MYLHTQIPDSLHHIQKRDVQRLVHVTQTKILERRKFIRPRPKFGHRSLNSEKPAVVHLVSLQRRFLKFYLQETSFTSKTLFQSIYFQTT